MISRRGFLGGILAAGASAAIIHTPGLIMPINPWLGIEVPYKIALLNHRGIRSGVMEFMDGTGFRFVPKFIPAAMGSETIWTMYGHAAAMRKLIEPIDLAAMTRMRKSRRDMIAPDHRVEGSSCPVTYDNFSDVDPKTGKRISSHTGEPITPSAMLVPYGRPEEIEYEDEVIYG